MTDNKISQTTASVPPPWVHCHHGEDDKQVCWCKVSPGKDLYWDRCVGGGIKTVKLVAKFCPECGRKL